MQRILSVVGQAVRKSILIVCLMSLLSLSNLFIFASQPASATQLSSQQEQAAESREDSYEEAVEEATNPKKMDEVYEENVKDYKEAQPNKGLVEGAKDLVDKVTGK